MIQNIVKTCLLGFTVAILYFMFVFAIGVASVGVFDAKKAIYFVLLTPIVEEIIFRGIIQKYLASKISYKLYAISVANVFTSVLFSAMHMFTSSVLISVSVFVPSIFLGYLYDRNNNVLPCIFTHAIFNMNIFVVYDVYKFMNS